MHHVKFVLKLCNPHEWKFDMQFIYINLKFRPILFVIAHNKSNFSVLFGMACFTLI